jgi:hypothetical protein
MDFNKRKIPMAIKENELNSKIIAVRYTGSKINDVNTRLVN